MTAVSFARILPAPLRRFGAGAAGRRATRSIVYLLPFVVLIFAWNMAATGGRLPPNILPPPKDVLATLQDLARQGVLGRNIIDSVARLGLGVAMGIVSGVALGILMGLNRYVAAVFEPVCSFFNALSGISWIPLALVWFGIGPASVTFILWNSVFFLVAFNTMLGVRTVPRVFEYAALTLGASRWQTVRDVTFPGALPNIAAGIRMGISFGWRALIAAEMVGATSGLGFMIYDASVFHRTDIILSGIIVIGIIWLSTHHLILMPIERWTIERWGMMGSQP